MNERYRSGGCGEPDVLRPSEWARVRFNRDVYLDEGVIQQGDVGRLFNIPGGSAAYYLRTRPWQDVRFYVENYSVAHFVPSEYLHPT